MPGLDDIRRLLRHGVHGRLQVRPRDERHDGRVDDGEPPRPVHAQVGPDAAPPRRRHHGAGAARVRVGRPDEPARHERFPELRVRLRPRRRGLPRAHLDGAVAGQQRRRAVQLAQPAQGGHDDGAVRGVGEGLVLHDGGGLGGA